MNFTKHLVALITLLALIFSPTHASALEAFDQEKYDNIQWQHTKDFYKEITSENLLDTQQLITQRVENGMPNYHFRLDNKSINYYPVRVNGQLNSYAVRVSTVNFSTYSVFVNVNKRWKSITTSEVKALFGEPYQEVTSPSQKHLFYQDNRNNISFTWDQDGFVCYLISKMRVRDHIHTTYENIQLMNEILRY